MIRNSIWALAALCALTTTTHAEFVITLTQDGSGNVDAVGSGTLNLSALSHTDDGPGGPPVMYTSIGVIGVGAIASPDQSEYSGFTGPTTFGSGAPVYATSGTGDAVDIVGIANVIYVPYGYVSGTSLSATDTWAGATFDSLGITPGTYTWTWGTGPTEDSFVITTNSAPAVPEPSSFVLLGLIGVVGCAAYRLRRRPASAVATG